MHKRTCIPKAIIKPSIMSEVQNNLKNYNNTFHWNEAKTYPQIIISQIQESPNIFPMQKGQVFQKSLIKHA